MSSEDSRSYIFPNTMTSDVLSFPNGDTIGSVTVLNQSNAQLSFFESGNIRSASATPDFFIGAYQSSSIPFPNVASVGVRFDGSNLQGTAYLHYSSAFASAPTSPIASSPQTVLPYSLTTSKSAASFLTFNGIPYAFIGLSCAAPFPNPPVPFVGYLYAECLEVFGIPRYVSSGVFFTPAGASIAPYWPANYVELLTGAGRWKPTRPLAVAAYLLASGAPNYGFFVVVSNYDNASQFAVNANGGSPFKATLSGYFGT